jgi:hypothetical protein
MFAMTIRHTVSMTVRSVIESPSDREPIPVPEIVISRRPDAFAVHTAQFEYYDDMREGFKMRDLSMSRDQSTALAWASFVTMLGACEFAVFVGPGTEDIALRDIVVLSDEFQIFTVSPEGEAVFVQRAVHRLQALQAAKQIVADGGCPLVLSHYLDPGYEWDEEHVEACEVQRQELVEVAS